MLENMLGDIVRRLEATRPLALMQEADQVGETLKGKVSLLASFVRFADREAIELWLDDMNHRLADMAIPSDRRSRIMAARLARKSEEAQLSSSVVSRTRAKRGVATSGSRSAKQ